MRIPGLVAVAALLAAGPLAAADPSAGVALPAPAGEWAFGSNGMIEPGLRGTPSGARLRYRLGSNVELRLQAGQERAIGLVVAVPLP